MNSPATRSRRDCPNAARRRHGAALTLPILLSASLWLGPPVSRAAPGAHGPDGQHLDAPTSSQPSADVPRLETHTELFELVARLAGGELSMLIDRYETNEPVLGAQVEVESGGLKARATFHADHGDYAVDDKALLDRLLTPGEHAIVITVRAGADSDLLDGTLRTTATTAAAAAGGGHGHAHGGPGDHGHHHEVEIAAWIGAGAIAIGLGGAWWWRRRRATPVAPGVQA